VEPAPAVQLMLLRLLREFAGPARLR